MNVKENNKKKNMKPILIAGAAVACLGIAGVSAYFTDAAKITNTFTVGKVEVTPSEPDWTPPTDIVPNQEFDKNPKVTNSGKNSAYVFIQVKIPKAKVAYADADGTKHNEDKSESVALFDCANGGTPGFNTTNWAELTSEKDETAEYVTRTFVYGTSSAAEALTPGGKTESLFTTIKFKNVLEGQSIEGSKLNVDVTTFAIQTDYLGDETNDGSGATTTDPAAIWAILKKQAPTVDEVDSHGQPITETTDDQEDGQ